MSDVCMISTLFIRGHENDFTLLFSSTKGQKKQQLLSVSVITALSGTSRRHELTAEEHSAELNDAVAILRPDARRRSPGKKFTLFLAEH